MKKHSADLPLPDTIWLNSEDFEYLCFDFAREQLTYKEPIPDFSTRNSALLESALGSPKQAFGGNLLYSNLVDQASILFYSLIKNHPFKNGNKRIAVMALLVFLALNKKWLSVSPKNLYELAVHVAETDPKLKDEILMIVSSTTKNNLITFPLLKK